MGVCDLIAVGGGSLGLQIGETFTAPILQGALPEGLPVPCAVLILADPGAGKELLTLELLSTHWKAGHKVLWISLENFPSAVNAMFQSAGVGETVHERTDSLEFVDCYSSQIGAKSTESYSADPSNLPNLCVVTSLAVSKLSRDHHLVVMLDSLSSLVQMVGARAAIEFFRTLVGKVRSVQGDLLTTLNRKAFSPTVLASIQEMVDGVLELRMIEDQTDVRRFLRIRKMLRRKYASVSIPYEIDQEHGVLRRIDGDSVGLVSGVAIDVNEHDWAEDVRSTTWSGSTNGSASPWEERLAYGREENGMERNDRLGTFSDRKIENHGASCEELTQARTVIDKPIELLRGTNDRSYASKKKAFSQVLPSVEFSSMTESTTIEDALLRAIDDGLLALGEIVRDTIYDRFEKKCELKREDIPEKLDAFHKALHGMFGAGAKVIETQIVKSLDSRLGLDFTAHIDWTIVDYFHLAKKARGT